MAIDEFTMYFWGESLSEGHYDFKQNMKFAVYSLLSAGMCDFLIYYKNIPLLNNGKKYGQKLHDDLVNKMLRAPVTSFFDRVPIGKILGRFSNDLTELGFDTMFFFSWIITTVFDLIHNFIFSSVMSSPLIIIFFLIAGYLSYKVSKRGTKLVREIVHLRSTTKEPIYGVFTESLNGLTPLRVFNRQNFFINKFYNYQDVYVKISLFDEKLWSWIFMRIGFYSVVGIGLTAIIPFLTMPAALITQVYIGILIRGAHWTKFTITEFMGSTSAFEKDIICFKRCEKFMNVEEEVDQGKIQTPWLKTGKIEYQDYSMRYRPSLPLVLRNISFTVNSGEKIGVVGRTGAGKSSLFSTILRITNPESGRILIDGIDIKDIKLQDLRRSITIIPQDPILFDGTLKENIDLFSEYSDEKIWSTLDLIGLGKKFEKDDGLRSRIIGGGGNLSSGERQLICIGRAILTQSKIILFDEATSNIDSNTEDKIIEILRTHFKNSTILTIAHRLKTVINSDKIMVLENGTLAEFDQPEILLNDSNSRFYKLWREYKEKKGLTT